MQVFGEVAEGLETLTRINEAYVDEKCRPYKNIRIKHTYILDDPFDDPPQLADLIPEASPEGKPKDEVFGEVAEGLETLTRINEAYVDEKCRPYKNIRIKHTYVLADPFDDHDRRHRSDRRR